MNLLLGLGGASGRGSANLGCWGMFAISGSSAQKKGEATFVPRSSRDVSREPSSDTVVCVVTSRRGESGEMSLQCTT